MAGFAAAGGFVADDLEVGEVPVGECEEAGVAEFEGGLRLGFGGSEVLEHPEEHGVVAWCRIGWEDMFVAV